MGDDDYDYLFKVVIIGDSGVGKSNIFTRFMRNEFALDSKSTIGVEFSAKNIPVKDRVVKAQVWDTAGQERFQALAKSYYRGAVGCLLVYDISNYESFKHVDKWLRQVKDSAEPHLVTLLIGNKSDLEEKRAVKQEEALEYAEKHGMGFIETSAKDDVNIQTAFTKLVTEIYTVLEEQEDDGDNNKVEVPEQEGKTKSTSGGESVQLTTKKHQANNDNSGCPC